MTDTEVRRKEDREHMRPGSDCIASHEHCFACQQLDTECHAFPEYQ